MIQFETKAGEPVRTLRTIVLGLALLGGLGSCTPWLTDVQDFGDPEAAIRREAEANQIPSLAAWVLRDGEIVFRQYYGIADLAGDAPAGSGTIYGVASVSKLVVVTAAMQLRERGLLDLDADIDTYLPFSVRNPSFPDVSITPYHLMTHTSGLNWPESESEVPGFYTDYELDSSPPLEEWLPQFLLAEGESYVPTVWVGSRPGDREYYSNMGVALLAYVVEAVSGVDFNEYCKGQIFEPLDMHSTSFAYSDLSMDDLATPYGPTRAPLPHTRNRAFPAGDLKTTVEDFSHFMTAYVNRGRYGDARILNEDTVDEILTIRNAASGTALIWHALNGGWYGHEGGKTGVAAYVELQPEAKAGLMVVANFRHGSIYPGGKIHALLRRIAEGR